MVISEGLLGSLSSPRAALGNPRHSQQRIITLHINIDSRLYTQHQWILPTRPIAHHLIRRPVEEILQSTKLVIKSVSQSSVNEAIQTDWLTYIYSLTGLTDQTDQSLISWRYKSLKIQFNSTAFQARSNWIAPPWCQLDKHSWYFNVSTTSFELFSKYPDLNQGCSTTAVIQTIETSVLR
jgi:hypothetical protein